MGPIVKELSEKYADKSIRFVTFDFTTDETKAAAEAKAKELGVETTYKKNAPQTGFVLLYETRDDKVLDKLSAANDVEAWSEKIDAALPSAG